MNDLRLRLARWLLRPALEGLQDELRGEVRALLPKLVDPGSPAELRRRVENRALRLRGRMDVVQELLR